MKLAIACFCILISSASLRAQTTRVSDEAALELRATQALNAGDYALALPILQKLAEHWKDQPDRLGPVQEQIRVCRRNLVDAQAGAQDARPHSEESRAGHVPPPPGQWLEMDMRELGNFSYDSQRGGGVPEDVQRLSGVRFRTRGYMLPLDQADKVTHFALVPDLFACCFGQPPQIQHTLIARCPKGKSVSYYPDQLIVEGTLTVREKRDDGFIVSLFELEVTSVKPAPR